MNEHSNIVIKSLESKIWFRFLKVIFVFAFLAISLVVLLFAYDNKPYTTIDEYNSVIVCDNGTRYKAGDNDINATEVWAEQLGATRVDIGLSDYELSLTESKVKATHLCQNYSERKIGFIPDVPPYKIELVKKTVGNWASFIGYTALALFAVVIIFELIRRTFFYIAIGKKFFR